MNNDWYENGKLPPIGCKVLTSFKEAKFKSAKQAHGKEALIVAHANNIAIFEYFHEGCKFYHGFYSGHFIPVKTEREKVVDRAVNGAVICLGKIDDLDFVRTLAANWYDGGMLRLPEDL